MGAAGGGISWHRPDRHLEYADQFTLSWNSSKGSSTLNPQPPCSLLQRDTTTSSNDAVTEAIGRRGDRRDGLGYHRPFWIIQSFPERAVVPLPRNRSPR